MSVDLNWAAQALEVFMDEEESKGAEEGLAYEIAGSLKAEAEEGGTTALRNLPPLKQSILDYAIEYAAGMGHAPDEEDTRPKHPAPGM
jgi:hypothetical protein